MDRAYVEWVRIEKFRCIRSVDLHLTPLHALIGPNDGGKSSLLRAMQVTKASGLPVATFWTSNGGLLRPGGVVPARYPSLERADDPSFSGNAVLQATALALLRLDPDELRAPSELFAARRPMWFRSERGSGLAAIYEGLVSRDIPAFLAISKRFTELFPSVRTLRMANPDQNHKAFGLTLTDGTEVGPEAMSEGMLYWLAFAVIEHLNPMGMIMIEAPEHGLHPSRIPEVMRMLRAVAQRAQVVLATHSPLIIDELKPEEVTIVTRTAEAGTICTPMTKTTSG